MIYRCFESKLYAFSHLGHGIMRRKTQENVKICSFCHTTNGRPRFSYEKLNALVGEISRNADHHLLYTLRVI